MRYSGFLPIYILYSVVDDDDIICYTKLFSRLLTVASTIVVICGLMDMFLGVGIGNSIAIFTNAASLIESMLSILSSIFLSLVLMLLMV